MNVDVEDLDSTRKKMSVRVPAERVSEKRASVFRAVAGEASVKGFRKGKVPRDLIESMYGKEIDQETASALVSETFREAVAERSLSPVTRPDVTDMDALEAGKEFGYSARFEVMPEFELSDYGSMSLTKNAYEATEEEIDGELESLRERAAQTSLLEDDRPARDGDYVVVDYAGALPDGGTIDDLNREGVALVLGKEQFLPEFEENILGKKAGEESRFSVSYPEDFPVSEAAGKEVGFTLVLKEIHERTLPALDDDFAGDFDLETLSELRERIRERLVSRHDAAELSRMKDQAVENLLEDNRFDVPPSMLEKQKEYLRAKFESDMAASGIEPPGTGEDADAKFAEKADESVRTAIILDRISREENLAATQNEIDREIGAVAAAYDVPPDSVRRVYRERGMMDDLRTNITHRKVLDFLVERASVEEVRGTAEPIDNEKPS